MTELNNVLPVTSSHLSPAHRTTVEWALHYTNATSKKAVSVVTGFRNLARRRLEAMRRYGVTLTWKPKLRAAGS
jgi:hypothetical protein